MVQFDQFEKLAGGAPYRILDKHPDGRHIVMQAKAHYSDRSAVWEQGTGRIVWKPERAIALAWLRDGTHLGVLREASETQYEFVIYTWPEVQPLYQCSVAPPFGWGEMLDLVISPQNNFALCQWIDQSETGFEFINITTQAVIQDTQSSYFLKGTNDVTRPVFSPTGYLVISYMKSGGPQIQKISIPMINQHKEANIGSEQSWCFKENSHSLKQFLLSQQSPLDGYQ